MVLWDTVIMSGISMDHNKTVFPLCKQNNKESKKQQNWMQRKASRLEICPSAETLLQNYFRTHADSLDGNQSATYYDSDFLSTRLASQQEKQRKLETCKVIVYIWTGIPGFFQPIDSANHLQHKTHQYLIDTLASYHPFSKTLSPYS